MKKFISLILICVVAILAFTGCDKSEETFEDELLSELNVIYEQLLSELPNTSDLEAQKEYLLKWASSHDIAVSYDKHDNIIMSKKATEGYEEAPSTILHCAIGTGEPEQQYQAMATALYIINQTQQNGFIRVLFTAAEDSTFRGANSISTNYLKADNLINLTFGEKTIFTIGSAGSSTYSFSKELEWIAPTYPNAYELSIRGLNGGDSGNTGTHPNPIKTIGDFLASAKSKGVLIELASFNGGQSADKYPSDATAVVLINDNDIPRFEKWFGNDAEKFNDRYGDIELNYTYTLTPVERPQTVISKDDSTNIFSLLYTMINGVYLKSEEKEIIAASNIGTISTQAGNLDLTICARSLKEETLQDISSTFEVICGLNEVSYTVIGQSPIWTENEESPLMLTITDLFLTNFDKKIKHKTVMENTENAIFKNRNNALDIISMSVNFENGVFEIEGLKNFLEENNSSDLS